MCNVSQASDVIDRLIFVALASVELFSRFSNPDCFDVDVITTISLFVCFLIF